MCPRTLFIEIAGRPLRKLQKKTISVAEECQQKQLNAIQKKWQLLDVCQWFTVNKESKQTAYYKARVNISSLISPL